jgi:DNA repair protein RecO (recombination protein O)
MQWADEAIVLSVRSHAETAAVVELLTREHGRHLGLVHGGRSRKARPILQPGNHIDVVWKARLSEHLGAVTIEPRRGFGVEVMEDATALTALTSLTTLAHVLPERDPHPNLFEVTLFVLGFLDDPTVWPALYVRWEMALLDEMGFGLDLATCAATGATADLIYVSPKSGRAVSAGAGEPYKDRLLMLPPFLRGETGGGVAPADIDAGLVLTAHFIERRLFAPSGEPLPDPRRRLPALVSALTARA